MRTTQQLVRIGDLEHGAFVPAKGESHADFRTRLLAKEQDQDAESDFSKVAEYCAAIERGAVLPPVFGVERDGVLSIVDGWHRCAAAALHGRAAIRAVIFKVTSWAGADEVSELLFDLEEAGHTWQHRAAAGAALLAPLAT